MEDLLREEDFLKKPDYNPWPRFLLFYGIEVAAIIANVLVMLLADTEYFGAIASITLVFLPTILAPVMILHKKKYTLMTGRQVIWGMLILFFIYLTPVLFGILSDLLTSGLDSGGITITIALFIAYGLNFLIVNAIVRRRRNRS